MAESNGSAFKTRTLKNGDVKEYSKSEVLQQRVQNLCGFALDTGYSVETIVNSIRAEYPIVEEEKIKEKKSKTVRTLADNANAEQYAALLKFAREQGIKLD